MLLIDTLTKGLVVAERYGHDIVVDKKYVCVDSDQHIIEDPYGYRYRRVVTLSDHAYGVQHYLYRMI